jgi:integrase
MPLEDRDRLLAGLDPAWRPFVTVMFYTGARPVELGRLRWRDVLGDRRAAGPRLVLRDRKGRPPEWVTRAVPLHLEALAMLPEPGPAGAPVFMDRDGRSLVDDTEREAFTAQARHQLRKAFAAACRAAGLDPMTPYWARHTFASRIVQQTGNLQAAADLLGHSGLAMVSRHYGRLAGENYAEAIAVQGREGNGDG